MPNRITLTLRITKKEIVLLISEATTKCIGSRDRRVSQVVRNKGKACGCMSRLVLSRERGLPDKSSNSAIEKIPNTVVFSQ